MKRLTGGFLLMLIAVIGLGADARYDRTDPEVVELNRLYREQGLSFPASAYPLNKRALFDYASRLYEQSSSTEQRKEIVRFIDALDYQEGRLEMGFSGDGGYERYIGGEGKWAENADFAYLFSRQVPLIDLEMFYRMEGVGGFATYTPVIREYDGQTKDNFFIGKDNNPVALNNKFVRMGTFWYFFGPFEVEFGRDVLHIGPLKNSLMPSDRLPFVDMLRFRLPLGGLTMDWTLMTMENRQAVNDITMPPGFAFRENTVIAAVHRFEYAWDHVVLGVSGNVVYARKQNGFVLGDFFPVFSWHQADIMPNNLSVLLDLNITPLPGLRVAMMGGLDDFNANTVGIGDSGVPTIPAYIVGAEYGVSLPFADMLVYIEVGNTHYLWGNFQESDALSRAIYRIALDTGSRILPLTSPYGPGAFWLEGDLTVAGILDFFDVGLSAAYLEKNPAADLVSTPYEASEAVASANPIRTFSVGLPLQFTRYQWLDIHVEPALFIRDGDVWVQADIGARVRFNSLVYPD